ncbi:MAG: hypothetical protein MJA29_02630 [Candidatus Omnitrophica bacterium]|nr:hypothetical protein [Candidatus Omnitrophota bacterium]
MRAVLRSARALRLDWLDDHTGGHKVNSLNPMIQVTGASSKAQGVDGATLATRQLRQDGVPESSLRGVRYRLGAERSGVMCLLFTAVMAKL